MIQLFILYLLFYLLIYLYVYLVIYPFVCLSFIHLFVCLFGVSNQTKHNLRFLFSQMKYWMMLSQLTRIPHLSCLSLSSPKLLLADERSYTWLRNMFKIHLKASRARNFLKPWISRGYSFHLCCFENLFMIKFSICIWWWNLIVRCQSIRAIKTTYI